MSYAHAMLVHRPYVVGFLLGFLVLSLTERGVLGTLTWLAIGTFVGWLAEAVSIRTAFPFGMYSYHSTNFPDELWLAGVPLFASLSFAFLSYFAFSTARTLLGTIEGRGWAMRRTLDPALDRSPSVALLGAAITVWLDLVIDPVSLIGRHWFLGNLYHYESPARHFGVPLTNYVGWFITCSAVGLANQALDRWLERRQRGPHPWFSLPFQPLLGALSCIGAFAFMIGITVHVALSQTLPATVPISWMLFNGVLLGSAFVAFVMQRMARARREAPAT